jgi:hypothetical protein
VHPAQHAHRVRAFLLRQLQNALGRIDGRRDGRGADDIRPRLANARSQGVVIQVIRHRVDERDVRVSCLLQRACKISHPGGRPATGDFGTA